jgi:hypothetical protein
VHFDEDDWVSFRTFPSPGSSVVSCPVVILPLQQLTRHCLSTEQRELKMVALSCDRYFEDKDDEMWARLNQKEG